MTRQPFLAKLAKLLVAAACSLAFSPSPTSLGWQSARAEEPANSEPTEPAELPEHLRAIQQSLGGSVVEQFGEIDVEGNPAWWQQFRGQQGWGPGSRGGNTWEATWTGTMSSATGSEIIGAAAQTPIAAQPYVPEAAANAPQAAQIANPTLVITALREVAARLDITANRLERLELYGHADALRKQARELRMDARRRSTLSTTPARPPYAPTSTFPVPADSPSAPLIPVDPRITPPAPTTDLPRTGSTGSWHLHWVGPAPQETGDEARVSEPAAAPVWSEDRDSSAPFQPPTRRRDNRAALPR